MNDINLYSNPYVAQQRAVKYLGDNAQLYLSSRKDKKYQIYDPTLQKWVHFGQRGYEDYTIHHDDERRRRYLNRATKIKGNWKNNPYSPNNLSINILW
jgi:hypothetical protein